MKVRMRWQTVYRGRVRRPGEEHEVDGDTARRWVSAGIAELVEDETPPGVPPKQPEKPAVDPSGVPPEQPGEPAGGLPADTNDSPPEQPEVKTGGKKNPKAGQAPAGSDGQ